MTAVIVGQGPRSATICNDRALTIIAGPCVLENRGMAIDVAQELVQISDQLDVKIVFKASFDKANRTNGQSREAWDFRPPCPFLRKSKN